MGRLTPAPVLPSGAGTTCRTEGRWSEVFPMASQPPIRIAFFTDSLEPSGVGEVLSLLSRNLPLEGYCQTLICCDGPALDPLVERCAGHMGVRRLTVRDDG